MSEKVLFKVKGIDLSMSTLKYDRVYDVLQVKKCYKTHRDCVRASGCAKEFYFIKRRSADLAVGYCCYRFAKLNIENYGEEDD